MRGGAALAAYLGGREWRATTANQGAMGDCEIDGFIRGGWDCGIVGKRLANGMISWLAAIGRARQSDTSGR
jgi:hypothetical protein